MIPCDVKETHLNERVLSFALTIAFAISLCVCTVEAFPLMDESIAPMRASDYFSYYSAAATGGTEGDVAISIGIRATKTMSSIGATKIVIQEKMEIVGKKHILKRVLSITAY